MNAAADDGAPDKEIKNPPRLGDKDINGRVIQAIFASTRQYVIYQSDNEIRYNLPDDYALARTGWYVNVHLGADLSEAGYVASIACGDLPPA